MTVQHLDSDNSDDDSDADDMVSLPYVNIYRQKYQLLLERCEVLQQDNDRLMRRFVFTIINRIITYIRVHTIVFYHSRIYLSKNSTKQYKKDIKLLVERLDTHEDPFRMTPIDEIATLSQTKHRPTMKPHGLSKQTDKQNASGSKKQATKRKMKADRVCYIFYYLNLVSIILLENSSFIFILYYIITILTFSLKRIPTHPRSPAMHSFNSAKNSVH